MGRPVLAFAIAPLWVPVLGAAAMARDHTSPADLVVMTIGMTIFAYGGTALFAVPAYRLLRRWPYALLGAAIGLGFVAGVLTFIALLVAVGWGEQIVKLILSPAFGLRDVRGLLPMGALGSLVGLTLWFIGRPRPSHHLPP